jgi:nitrogen fixation/metabolism regulation signal transduction histidine kinase
MEIVFIVTAIIVAIFIIAYGVFLSHRVAGPLYRMNRYLEENTGKVNPGELRFRKGDYFPELAENFNNYIKYIKELNK